MLTQTLDATQSNAGISMRDTFSRALTMLVSKLQPARFSRQLTPPRKLARNITIKRFAQMPTLEQEADIWQWPCFNPPGLLIGPLPHVKNCFGRWIQDYSHPGVAERIRVEVDFIEDIICGGRK
jgi:hypothetical protein